MENRNLNVNYPFVRKQAERGKHLKVLHISEREARRARPAAGGEEGDGQKIGCLQLPNWIPKVRSAP